MKLFLSSYRLGNDPHLLTAIVGDNNRRAALIANARDLSEGADRSDGVQREVADLRDIGLEPEELDLREYFDGSKDLAKDLSQFGLVWLLGGNSFILRRAMVQSGFDKAVRPQIDSDKLVYGGYSAGACVATPNLHGIELVDTPDIVPDSYEKEVVWEG